MAVSAILNFGQFSTRGSCNTSFYRVFQDGESISGVIFGIQGQSQGQIQRSKIKFDWTQFKLEDIGYINAALLPRD